MPATALKVNLRDVIKNQTTISTLSTEEFKALTDNAKMNLFNIAWDHEIFAKVKEDSSLILDIPFERWLMMSEFTIAQIAFCTAYEEVNIESLIDFSKVCTDALDAQEAIEYIRSINTNNEYNKLID